MRSLLSIALCMLVGWGGSLLGLPLAYMFGAIAAMIIAHRLKVDVSIPKHSLTIVQIVLGSSVGLMVKGLQGEAAQDILLLLPSLLICLGLQFGIGYLWFNRKLGWSREESMLGAVPGAMAAVLAISEHTQTPPQKVVISHAIRLVILIIIAGVITGLNPPPATEHVPYSDELNVHIFSFATLGMVGWLLLIAAGGYFSGRLLERMHVPAPYMLTSLVVAISMHYLTDRMLTVPDFLSFLSMTLIGMRIGRYFTAFSISMLIQNIWASVQAVFVSMLVTVLVALVTAHIMGYPVDLLILAWAPGSMEAMLFAAMAMKVNVGIIMSSHIIRMILLHAIPAVALFFRRRKQ
ncbi:AbrB family transcriptional regulator [Xenorhabdus sp. 42]|uniref:AbrB family transcriptional regulator n=1 Tax=Xenorhabdus szentirmaii TaxID=290112 RepID=A0AAW3YVS0_9GAMM|nr:MULTISPECIES: AbrB family transcriptional regulator [Xenorhabdus]MBD2779819.1 AbrB family transcriptional regulator [Xenorhabdus sp. 38]MBD2800278.1 AbrB family transcriptional regulator [Xenorhabdus sp. M]MBD2804358.1 AbrB family transcriptional regulator [Xenorhabdus sp. ZM]MBD2821856.1 AbrB family transcriptional regulator [Xenorhabdus sp. 42]PHM41438.1 hypothetical protein Xszus_01126 [Xenorhabdus szentirmaii]